MGIGDNFYSDDEEKVTLGERIRSKKEDIRLAVATSSFNRKKSIKKATKLIHELNPKDVNMMQEISSLINRLELCDPRYGGTLDYAVYQEFLSKIKKNGNMEKLYNSVAENQVSYDSVGLEIER